MGEAYREITKTYFSSLKTWLVWMLYSFWLCMVTFARWASDDTVFVLLLGGTFAWLLGCQVFNQMVHAHLCRLPNAGRVNLHVGVALIAFACVALPTTMAWLGGATVLHVMPWLLLSAGVGTLAVTITYTDRGINVLFILIVVFSLFPSVLRYLTGLAVGDVPVVLTIPGLVGLVSFGVAIHRLVYLQDWSVSFVHDEKELAWKAQQEEILGTRDKVSWSSFGSRQMNEAGLERLRTPVPTTLLARARLRQLGWQLKGRWSDALYSLAFMCGIVLLFEWMSFDPKPHRRDAMNNVMHMLVLYSFIVPILLFWKCYGANKKCLGAESLRPASRQRFVRELTFAVGLTWFGAWLITIAVVGLTVALLRPEWYAWTIVANYVFCSLAIQSLICGALAAWETLRSLEAQLAWAAVIIFVGVPFGLIFGQTPFASTSGFVMETVTAIVGCALIVTAYVRWCSMELGMKE